MTTRFAKPDRTRPLWQTFLAPMLLVSLGLHGLLLMLPSGSSGDAVVPPPDPEQDSVAITRVPPPGTAAAPAGVVPTPLRPGVAPVSTPQPVVGSPAQGRSAAAAASRTQGRSPAASTRTQGRSPSGQSVRPAAPATPADSAGPAAANPSPAPPPAAAPQPSGPLFDAELGERLLAYVASLNLPAAQVDRAAASVQNRFGYNAAATTRDAFNTNKTQWESAIQQQTGSADLTAEEERSTYSTVYPQRVCLATEPGEIRVGALVNADGTWQGQPALLRSSGYAALDRKALQEIQSHRFAPGDGLRAYVLTIEPSVSYGRRPCLNPNPGT